jgi:ferredoxin
VKVRVDLDLCQGHGVCAEEAPDVFALDESASKVVLRDPSPPEEQRARVKAAVRYCPTHALALLED